jgi:hypothetical protein
MTIVIISLLKDDFIIIITIIITYCTREREATLLGDGVSYYLSPSAARTGRCVVRDRHLQSARVPPYTTKMPMNI